MGDAIPLCASPCGNATVSYQKGTQSLKVVVSIYKKIRLPEAFGGQSDGKYFHLKIVFLDLKLCGLILAIYHIRTYS